MDKSEFEFTLNCIIKCIKSNEESLKHYKKSQNQRMIDYMEGILAGLRTSYYFLTDKEYTG